MGRVLERAFASNLTNDEIDAGLKYNAQQLRKALLKTSPWDEATTVQLWLDGLLHVDHIIPVALFKEMFGAFFYADGRPTENAFAVNALWNLQLLEADRNLQKSDTFTAECKAGVAQRKRCYDAALRQDGSLDFDRYLVLLVADVRAGNHSIGAPANEP